MISFRIFVTPLLVGMLAGCSNISKFENRPQPGDAIVRCENPKAGGLTAGDASVFVEEIDGVATGFESNNVAYHVRPGKHRLALFVSTATMRQAREYFDLEAAAGRKYRLSAASKGRDFIVALADDTNPKAIPIIATVELTATVAYRPPALAK